MPVDFEIPSNVNPVRIRLLDASATNAGAMSAAMFNKLNGLIGGLVYTVGSASTGAHFTSVQAAINAAVAAGANAGNPVFIFIVSDLAEDITIHDGIHLVGGVKPSLGSLPTVIGGSVGFAVGVTQFSISNIYFLPGVAIPGNGVLDMNIANLNGSFFNCVFDSSNFDAPAMYSHLSQGFVRFDDCIFSGVGPTTPTMSLDLASSQPMNFNRCTVTSSSNNTGITYTSGNNVTPLAVFRDCILNFSAGIGPYVFVSGGVMNFIRGEIYADSHAFSISATAALEIIYTYFEVNAGNNCIQGTNGGKLRWGGLTFRPTFSNRVATTTLGVGATEMVIDSITTF